MNASHRADEDEGRHPAGAMSRRQFLDIAKAEVARANRHRNPLSCLLIGVEHLKSIGDTPDDTAGDLVLRQFVTVCKATIRACDYIGSIGPEEFAILLPETPLLSALSVAERILLNLAVAATDASQHRLTATTSMGVVEYADRTWSLDQFLKAGDAAMHDARHNGGNQAVCYLDDVQLTSVAATVN